MMSKYLKYFTESNAPVKPPSIVPGVESIESGAVAGLGGSDVFADIIVRNPAGKGITPTTTAVKKPNFGLGFDLTPSLAAQVMDVMRKHGDKEAKTRLGLNDEEKERFADTDDPNNQYDEFAAWQDINQAVGNYVRSRVNTELKPYQLGAVPSNPVSRYDGLDTTKMGLIVTKPSRAKVKINSAKY
jgi:hypothetical protein